MARETAAQNERALELLNIQPADHVLEVGFGHGRSLELAARRAPEGLVAGVDHSEQMAETAMRANARLVAGGRVEIRRADSNALPWGDRSFDRAFTVNTIYFWRDPRRDLGELARVLRPGGRLAVSFRHDDRAIRDFPEPFYRFWPPETVVSMLREAGFGAIATHRKDAGAQSLFWIVADRPPASPRGPVEH